MERHLSARLPIALTLAALLFAAAPVRGDDFSIETSFACVGLDCSQQANHTDGGDFKGLLTLTVENTGTQAWGDFHFEIVSVGYSVENVDFVVTSPNEPTSSQSPLTWAVDNVVVGATLDLFFYSDPVLPGEIASFTVYTDNTTSMVPVFGTLFYPTLVPEPGTLLLVGAGLIGIAGIGKRAPKRKGKRGRG